MTGAFDEPYPHAVSLADDLEAIAVAARDRREGLAVILAAEPASGRRFYVCGFEDEDGRSWLVLDGEGGPVTDRRDARDAVSIAALCEIAEEAAFPGDLDELRAQLVALRLTEAPPGIEDAEQATHDLQHTLGVAPQLATPARLDAIGMAAQRLERALDPTGASPFSTSMRSAQAVVDELWAEVEGAYLGPLD